MMTLPVRVLIMTLFCSFMFGALYFDFGEPVSLNFFGLVLTLSFHFVAPFLLSFALLVFLLAIRRRARWFYMPFPRAALDGFQVFARAWLLSHLILIPLVVVGLIWLDLTVGDCALVAEVTALLVGLALAPLEIYALPGDGFGAA